MVLKTLEFKDCALDDPDFRQNLHEHERELERTNRDIKQLIKECTDVISTSLTLSRLQKQLAQHLKEFNFETIGGSQTEDEVEISKSLKEFGRILCDIEEERSKILDNAMEQFIRPLEDFRRVHIGNVKAEKKKFDKESTKFYQSQEKHLSMSCRKDESTLKEADADLQLQRRHFIQASLRYVKSIQEVHERKKFEFVETLWSFMNSWMNFFRITYDVTKEHEPYMRELQVRVQKTRDSFISFCAEAEALMNKIKTNETAAEATLFPTTGFVYLMEKKAFATTWTKHYCTYDKTTKLLTLVPFSHTHGKPTAAPEVLTLKSCFRRHPESIDKRFCFDVAVEGSTSMMTFQALSELDRSRWMDVMDGKEPIFEQPGRLQKEAEFTTSLDDTGFRFVTSCIEVVEKRGISEQGLYRIAGVSSKATRLLQTFLEGSEKLNLNDENEWELRTVTSALKAYFRFLPEPLLTFRLHKPLIEAAKKENKGDRLLDVHFWIHTLPEKRERRMLELLIRHLAKIAANSGRNLMTISNLGVCFGPTLLRPKEESVAALVDIKFCNIIVEILIENWQKIFCTAPTVVKGKDSFTKASLSKHPFSSTSSTSSASSSHLNPVWVPDTPINYTHYQSVSPSEETSLKNTNIHFLPSIKSARILGVGQSPPSTDRQTNRQTDRPTNSQTDRQTNSQSVYYSTPPSTDGQTDRQTNSRTDRQTDRLTNSQSVYYSTPLEEQTLNGTHRDHAPLSTSGKVASVIARLTTPLATPTSHGFLGHGSVKVGGPTGSLGGGGEKNVTTVQTARPFVPVKENSPSDGGGTSSKSNGTLNTLNPLNTLNSVNPLNTLNTLNPLNPLNTLNTLNTVNTLNTLNTLNTPNSVNTVNSVNLVNTVNRPYSAGKPSRATILPVSFTQAALTNGLNIPPTRISGSVTPTMSPNSSRLSMLNDQTASRRRVRTLYQCHADVPSELSFEPNEIITSVRQSIEPGWLYGELRGKTGLVPENYVEELSGET